MTLGGDAASVTATTEGGVFTVDWTDGAGAGAACAAISNEKKERRDNMAGIIFSKGSGLNDSIYGKSQEPIRAVIEKNVEAFEQQSQIKNVFFMDSTRNYAEKYTQETSLWQL